MYVIKNKPKSGKIIWDAEKGQQLLKFEKGHFETEDAYIAEKAKALGYEVEETPDQPDKSEGEPDQPDKSEEKPKETANASKNKSGGSRQKSKNTGK